MAIVNQTCRVKGRAIWNARVGERAKPLTLQDVATKAGVTKGYIGMIERGDRPCAPDVARKIARALNRPLDELFDVEEKPPPRWARAAAEAEGVPDEAA